MWTKNKKTKKEGTGKMTFFLRICTQTTQIFLILYSFKQLVYCTQFTEPLSILCKWYKKKLCNFKRPVYVHCTSICTCFRKAPKKTQIFKNIWNPQTETEKPEKVFINCINSKWTKKMLKVTVLQKIRKLRMRKIDDIL